MKRTIELEAVPSAWIAAKNSEIPRGWRFLRTSPAFYKRGLRFGRSVNVQVEIWRMPVGEILARSSGHLGAIAGHDKSPGQIFNAVRYAIEMYYDFP
ncbi:hypothetical protein GWI33_017789 [Rhynchophorus ferrugineus]|uniref:Uncharacterized protein n=1 Tax=Rhynchophorus ferrugineus TaxID=354439 RepID=A0A834M3E3_RHYFE|nr:hypothetical protein GWI33_017789 [Rhynchophorus ferrugineus]